MSISMLRPCLKWITESSHFAITETGQIERLRASTHHTVQVLNSPNDGLDYNCVMYALDLVSNTEHKGSANTCLVQKLIDSGAMVEGHQFVPGLLCVYFDAESVKHIGRLVTSSRVRSKWGFRQLYEHGLLEVPQDYGNTVRVFSVPDRETVLSCLFENAK